MENGRSRESGWAAGLLGLVLLGLRRVTLGNYVKVVIVEAVVIELGRNQFQISQSQLLTK